MIPTILVKTSNRTLYIHEYKGVKGLRFQCLVALEPMHQKFLIGMILLCNLKSSLFGKYYSAMHQLPVLNLN